MNIRNRAAVYAGVPFMTTVAACLFTAVAVQATPGPPKPSESLVVLTDSGERRDGLPVVARHPAPDPYIYELTRGFSGRLLRLYPMVQRFAHPDRPSQPGYLVLTSNQGGFPRFGFHLDGRTMKETAYVDLHRNGDLTNRFGAINQIYPHELLHIIVGDLAGPFPEGRDNQVHAVAVRTDRVTAFSEGFAEHAQLMAVEAEDVAAETRRLAVDREQLTNALQWFVSYRDAMSARWSIAPKARMTFPLGFSRNEQVLRYHGVRQNLFAHEPQEPSHDRDLYSAYLIENTMPGPLDGPAKSAARLLATEGVVSALFYRLATSEALRQAYRDDRFYTSFGATRDAVDPVDNVYLKLFAAIHVGGYDTVRIIDAYTTLFPEDASSVREVVRSTLLGQDLPRAASIWLLNDSLQTGTSLFDQYRGLPRAHTFDLNAASALDLLSVRGVTPDVATAILDGAPYERVEDLKRVPPGAPFVGEFARMEAAYRAHAGAPDDDRRLSLETVLYPYLWRALYVALACTAISAALYRAVRRARWWRLAFNGLGVALAGLIAGWTIDPGSGLLALAAPIGLWGLPAAVIALRRTRSPRAAGIVLAAWTLASIVPAVIVRPMM